MLTAAFSEGLDPVLMFEFAKAKRVTSVSALVCGTKRATVKLARNLSSDGVGMRILKSEKSSSISRDDWAEILDRRTRDCHVAVVVDTACVSLDGYDVIFGEWAESVFYETHHWLLVVRDAADDDDGGSFEGLKRQLERAPLNINADVNVAVMGQGRNCAIFDVYNPAHRRGGRLKIEEIGFYDGKGIEESDRSGRNRYLKRRNMTGVQFKTAIVIPDDFEDLKAYTESQNSREGFSMHRFQNALLDHCREFYNYSMEMGRTNSWGYAQSDGHFDGMVGMIERREVDFGSSPLIVKIDRLPVLDYSSCGSWILRSRFIYRKPKIVADSFSIFLRPLAASSWLCVAAMMVLMMLILRLVFTREQRLLVGGTTERDGVESGWDFLFLFTLGAFCQQGATCYPQLLSSRTVSVFVFLFCILIYQFYSASIVSYLLMDPPRHINNLKDLLESSLRAGNADFLIDRSYYAQTTDPVAIELYARKIGGETGFYPFAVGVDMVREGGFAYHVETATAYPIIEETFTNREICDLEEVQMYRTQPMNSGLQKGSPFREMLNYCLLRMLEDGERDRQLRYWMARKPACIESAKKIEIHVGIREFSCGLIVLAYGITVSLLFLACELAEHKYRMSREKSKPEGVFRPFVR